MALQSAQPGLAGLWPSSGHRHQPLPQSRLVEALEG